MGGDVLKMISKGTVFKSIGDPHCDEWIYVYDPSNAHDDEVYTTIFSQYLVSNHGPGADYATYYEATRDLFELPIDEAKRIFNDIYDDDVEQYAMELNRVYDLVVDYGIKDPDPWFVFCRSMENPELYKIALRFLLEVSKRYDVMEDFNDCGFYHGVSTAKLIFYPSNKLKVISR